MSQSKQDAIVGELRAQIVEGRFEPGERLPTRADLQHRFQVSPVTMQRAFDTLIDDGFVETRGKAGTFVSRQAPHLTHYAMVLTGTERQSRWYRCLAHRVEALASATRRVSTYSHVDGHLDHPDYQRLVGDIQARRVAGIIFSTNPYNLVNTPLMTAPGIPRCALMTVPLYANIPIAYPDYRSFADRALGRLAERGRRRVAWLLNSPSTQGVASHIERVNEQLGIQTRPSWFQYPDLIRPENVRQIVKLLLDAPADWRPNALVIGDDNLVEAATGVLAEEGLGPGELEVVAYCNFPEPPPSAVEVIRLGFDVNAIIRHCVRSIDLLRRGRAAPAQTLFPALFEHELST